MKLQALGLQHYLIKAPAQVWLLQNLSKQLFYEIPQVAAYLFGVIQMQICDLKILLSVYKSNMTIMSIHGRRNADI